MLLSMGHPQIPWDPLHPHGATAACPMGRELQAQDTRGSGLQSPRYGNKGRGDVSRRRGKRHSLPGSVLEVPAGAQTSPSTFLPRL